MRIATYVKVLDNGKYSITDSGRPQTCDYYAQSPFSFSDEPVFQDVTYNEAVKVFNDSFIEVANPPETWKTTIGEYEGNDARYVVEDGKAVIKKLKIYIDVPQPVKEQELINKAIEQTKGKELFPEQVEKAKEYLKLIKDQPADLTAEKMRLRDAFDQWYLNRYNAGYPESDIAYFFWDFIVKKNEEINAKNIEFKNLLQALNGLNTRYESLKKIATKEIAKNKPTPPKDRVLKEGEDPTDKP